MKLAFLLPSDNLCGGNLVVYEHASHLKKAGHDTYVIFRDWERKSKGGESQSISDNPNTANEDLTNDDKELESGYPIWCKSLNYNINLLDWESAQEQEFDFVIATWWETAFEVFALSSNRYGYFVQSDERRFYSEQESLSRTAVALSYNLPLIFITEAGWIKEMLETEFGKTAALIPNGVSLERFNPVQPLEPKSPEKLRVLIEGSGAVPYKRISFAFKVARQVNDVEIWYISPDGVYESDWKPDRLFVGVPPNEMKSVYSSCDVLLKLSVVEGFFLPPLEMMACGGTAIVTKVSGYDEYIRDGENALTVEIDNEAEAVAALRRLKDDRELLSRLRTAGLLTAKAHTWEKSARDFSEFLETINLSQSVEDKLIILSRLSPGLLLGLRQLSKLEQYDVRQHNIMLQEHNIMFNNVIRRSELENNLNSLDAQFKEIVSYFALYPRQETVDNSFASLNNSFTSLNNSFAQLEQRIGTLEGVVRQAINNLSIKGRLIRFRKFIFGR